MIEGFAVETKDGLIFTVKGLLHPPSRVIAYLRYLPDPEGTRQRDGLRFRRLYRFEEQEAVLSTRYPTYLAYDPVFGLRLQSVPRQHVHSVYDPRQYLESLRERGATDALQDDAVALATRLADVASVPLANLGVSGSLMLGLHRSHSDLDFIVYGEAVGRAIHRALRHSLEEPGDELRRPNRVELAALHREHSPDTPLSFEEFARHQTRKVNELRFRGRETFVRFVKHPEDVQEDYGDRRFESLGPATVHARVIDDDDAIFTPCRYEIASAQFSDGAPAPDLQRIVSYRGRFSDQARTGERVDARGRLERVIREEGPAYLRLVVGGEAGDHLSSRAGAA